VSDHLVAGLHCTEATDLAAGFVLGALRPSEMAQVRAHLGGCPEAHPEFAELAAATPALLAAVPQVEPSVALGDRLMAAARAEAGEVRPAPPAAVAPTVVTPPVTAPPPVAPRRDWLGFLRPARVPWALAAAAIVIAVVLGARTLQLQQETSDLAAYQRGVAAVIDAAVQPGAQLAILAPGQSAGPNGLAAVGADGTIRIAMRDLTPTSGNQVYEAWAIAGSAAPLPIGGFQVGSSGSAAFVTTGPTASGVVIALTLEPGPGATTPTLPIVVSGAAQGHPAG